MTERTLVLIRPDGVRRGLVGDVLPRIERKGLQIIVLAGAADPVRAAPGTIQGDHALEVQENTVHGSDSPDSAGREIKIFFPDLV